MVYFDFAQYKLKTFRWNKRDVFEFDYIINIPLKMALNYTLKDNRVIEAKVTLLRIAPQNKKQLLSDIYTKLSDMSWVSRLAPFLQESYQERANRTLEALDHEITQTAGLPGANAVTSNAAEYIVSVLANDAVVNELGYKEVPLPEVFKHQRSQNPGFDFFAINAQDILLFGEAKYVANTNAYGRALEQIVRFVAEKNDIADLADLVVLVNNDILSKVTDGNKGYMAAFSSTNIPTDTLVQNIKNNANYTTSKVHSELVLIAVDML